MSLRESLASVFSPLRMAESRPRPDTSERGDSGISYSSTRSVAERRLRDLDHNYEWRGQNKWQICDRMRKSDGKIFGLRKAQTMPLLRAEVQITGSEDRAKVEFVRKALLEDFPWRAFLQTVATYIDYGFAAFAVNWRADADGKYRIDELRHLPCSSIRPENIYLQRGRITRIVQTPPSGGEFPIPGEYLLWFVHDKEGDDVTGRPILRAMHKSWYTKERLQVLLPVLAEKMGGVPVFTEDRPLSDVERATIDAMGESFVLGERMYIRKPEDVTFELVASHVNINDLLLAIKYFDTELTAVCQGQYLDLGVNQAGSRAYGSTLADMFADSIQAQASYIEDVLNARDGLIHQLVAYNFANDDDLPKLRFASIQHTDVAALTTSIQRLAASGMPLDGAIWDYVRSIMNFPESSSAGVAITGDVPQEGGHDRTPPAEKTPAETGTRAVESCPDDACGLRLAERRKPRGVERYVALDELSARFDKAKTAIREATQATRDKLVAELAGRAMAAQEKGALARFAGGAPPMVDRLAAEIRGVLTEFYGAGRQQVRDELRRQRQGEPVAEIVAERTAATAPAEMRPERPAGPATAVAEADLGLQAETTARAIATETLMAAALAAARLASVPLAKPDLEEAIRRESDASALRMGIVVSDVMQAGRADQAAEQAEEIEDAVYSAILDEAVCPACEAMDGRTTSDLEEAAGWTPNPACEGGGRCRCLTVYEYRQEAS